MGDQGAPGDKLELSCGGEHPLVAEEWMAFRILECLADPRAVCRLALVNKNFSAASISDLVWQTLLPPPGILGPLLPHVDYQPPSKKHLFLHLCKSITYDQGLKKFWLDAFTGGECHMISARALSVIWGDTPWYWKWESRPGSMFSEVACLGAVCWFDVSGTFQNVFRPGRYTISFRLQQHSPQSWQEAPVKLCVQNMTHAHPQQESQMLFDGSSFKLRPCASSSMFTSSLKQASDRKGIFSPIASGSSAETSTTDQTGEVDNIYPSRKKGSLIWVECDAGEFVVDDEANQPITVKFSMKEVDDYIGKRGLVLDGAIIRPSYVVSRIDEAHKTGTCLSENLVDFASGMTNNSKT